MVSCCPQNLPALSGMIRSHRPVAAIDIGTNTAVLLITDEPGSPNDIREERFVRLGEGLGSTGEISSPALTRIRVALREFRELIQSSSVAAVRVVGTSASREASNADQVAHLVDNTLGVTYEILTGTEEARYSFAGAATDDSAADDLSNIVVLDIGGGSTEAVKGSRHSSGWSVESSVSFDVGSVRFTERLFPRLPPDRAAADAAISAMRRVFVESGCSFCDASPEATNLVLVDGTSEVLSRIQRRHHKSSDRVLSLTEVSYWANLLLSRSAEGVLELHREALEGRADVFPMAVLILATFMEWGGFDACTLSRRSLLHGVATEMLLKRNNRS